MLEPITKVVVFVVVSTNWTGTGCLDSDLMSEQISTRQVFHIPLVSQDLALTALTTARSSYQSYSFINIHLVICKLSLFIIIYYQSAAAYQGHTLWEGS